MTESEKRLEKAIEIKRKIDKWREISEKYELIKQEVIEISGDYLHLKLRHGMTPDLTRSILIQGLDKLIGVQNEMIEDGLKELENLMMDK